jgi:hypothetical protein
MVLRLLLLLVVVVVVLLRWISRGCCLWLLQ